MKIDFDKYADGLVPAIIQDIHSGKVLMLGFMNEAAYEKTLQENKVVFYSRSKQRLWMKGEQSGNFLFVKEILPDCDNDTLLVRVVPSGPVCHTGAETCFHGQDDAAGFIYRLESVIAERKNDAPGKSYTKSLFASGLNTIVQKVGEEAVELVIASKDEDIRRVKDEAADLLYHYLVLLQAKGLNLREIEAVLLERHHGKK